MPPGRRVFSDQDEDLLAQYMAKYNPELKNRKGNALFKKLVENEEKKWSWGTRHSWQSWRDYYIRNEERMNRLIDRAIRRQAQKELQKWEAKNTASHSRVQKADPSPIKRKRVSDTATTGPKRIKVEETQMFAPIAQKEEEEEEEEEVIAAVAENNDDDDNEEEEEENSETESDTADDDEVAGLVEPSEAGTEAREESAKSIPSQAAAGGIAQKSPSPVESDGSSPPPSPTARRKRKAIRQDVFASPSPSQPEPPIPVAHRKNPPKLVEGPFTTSFRSSARRPTHVEQSDTEDEKKQSEWPPARSHLKSHQSRKKSTAEVQIQATSHTPRKIAVDRIIQVGSPKVLPIRPSDQPAVIPPQADTTISSLPPATLQHPTPVVVSHPKPMAQQPPSSPIDPFVEPQSPAQVDPVPAPRERRHTLSTAHPRSIPRIDLRHALKRRRLDHRKSLPAIPSRGSTSVASTMDIQELDTQSVYTISRPGTLSPSVSLSRLSISTSVADRPDLRARWEKRVQVLSGVYGFTDFVVASVLKHTKDFEKARKVLEGMKRSAEEVGVAALLENEDELGEEENPGNDVEMEVDEVADTRRVERYRSRTTVSQSPEVAPDKRISGRLPRTPHSQTSTSSHNYNHSNYPTPAHELAPASSQSQRQRRRLSKPRRSIVPSLELDIQPAREDIDERLLDYTPPPGSRAGRYARLVSQGRKEEALERERRLSIGLKPRGQPSMVESEVSRIDIKEDDVDKETVEVVKTPRRSEARESVRSAGTKSQKRQAGVDPVLQEVQPEANVVSSPAFPPPPETSSPPITPAKIPLPAPVFEEPERQEHNNRDDVDIDGLQAENDRRTQQEIDKVLSRKEQEKFWAASEENRKELEELQARVDPSVMTRWIAIKLGSLCD
ncbi:hypothetical protein AX16_007676 [Volvariella volvacea WC 439]|nr:hypothetical protein AX16_007676 [Volvariella volvacea WC 439]